METLPLALDMARDTRSACFIFHKHKLHKVKSLPRFLSLLVKYPGVCQSSPAPASLAFACVSSSLSVALNNFITSLLHFSFFFD